MRKPLITLLTDFGTADHYVASMKGVMAGLCPEAQFVDISHEVAPFAITEAAWTLAQAAPCFPQGTVHVVVVDPGVGSERRPIIGRSGGQLFVAPDNGVLTEVLGGEPNANVFHITADRWFRQPLSRTFHGRDVFAPVAGRLATGTGAAEFGPRIEDWVRLPSLRPVPNPDGSCDGVVIKADRFGNIITSLPAGLPGPWVLEIAGQVIAGTAESYAAAPPEELFSIAGSAGTIEISMCKASAFNRLAVKSGVLVRLRRHA
jgi:S-adenosyl-L-methionine hydrolase (adenosine-forming)